MFCQFSCSSKPVYGAQFPPRSEPGPPSAPTTPKKESLKQSGGGAAGGHDSFQEFAKGTEDAWDDADDELLTMASVKLSMQQVHDTAMQVKMQKYC